MTEDEFMNKVEEVTERMLKLIDARDKQIKFLLQYLGGIVLPTQMNAIVERLEKIKNESNS